MTFTYVNRNFDQQSILVTKYLYIFNCLGVCDIRRVDFYRSTKLCGTKGCGEFPFHAFERRSISWRGLNAGRRKREHIYQTFRVF